MPLSPRWRWKIDRLREKAGALFGSKESQARPRLCPSCGTLVGAAATKCHQCGASLTFSLAAASRSLGRLMPTTFPVTYTILTLSCLLYGVSLLATIRLAGGLAPPSQTLVGLLNLGGINSKVLLRLGMSLPLDYDLAQPWRLVMAIFLHGSLIHLAFNMWVLMDIGPLIEDLYGSARSLFLYVTAGAAGFVLSSLTMHPSVGGSGALLGLIGVLLAFTTRSGGAAMQMLRGHLIQWLIYIAIMGIMMPGIDNAAHLGGFAVGFVLGRLLSASEPATPDERKRAYLLGWGAALVVAASFGFMLLGYFRAS